MSAIDQVTQHFDALAIRCIEVPEWDLEIYVKPFTLAEKSKIYKLAQDDDLALMAYVLIHKALDRQGNPLFTLEDKIKLMRHADVNVVSRLAADIMLAPEVSEQKKPSRTNRKA
jgi:hypothetical protein